MGLFETITNAILPKQKNNFTRGNDFLKYGNRNILYPTWSDVQLEKKDEYKGYAYAAIQKRSNKVARLAKENLRTWANDSTLAKAQKINMTLTHPYLRLIESSTTFSQKKFWKDISMYLDLRGVYYLGVVRGILEQEGEEPIYGDAKEFILLNPYEITRIVNKDGEVGGYLEVKPDGRSREWGVHQIIEMRESKPENQEQTFSMVDAAKESLYTISQATDYARQTLNGNLNAPGIISTDVILQDEDFANFIARMKNSQKGEPIFGNGSGAIKWQPMQVNLDQAALTNIKAGSRDEFFAVSGTSKTILGIEESGTTRETSRTQTELFISEVAEPRLEDIIDYLNLDYKSKYPSQYRTYGYLIEVVASTSKDYDASIKAVQLKREEYQLAQDMMDMGYTKESAIQYAKGEIDLDQIQEIEFEVAKEEAQEEAILEEISSDTPQDGESGSEEIIEDPAEEQPAEENSVEKNEADKSVVLNEDDELVFEEDWNGWLGAVVKPINVLERLKVAGKDKFILDDEQVKDYSSIPAEKVPHFTLMYGFRDDPEQMKDLIDGAVKGLKEVTIKKISHFDLEYGKCIVALLDKTPELLKARKNLEKLPYKAGPFGFDNPHITLVYIDKEENAEEYYSLFEDLPGQIFEVLALDYGNGYENGLYNIKPEAEETEEESIPPKIEDNAHYHEDGTLCTHCHSDTGIETYHNDLSDEDVEIMDNAYNSFIQTLRSIQKEAINKSISKVTINSFEEEDILTEEDKIELSEKLKNAVKDYWWILVPMFATTLISQRNNQFKTKYNFVFSDDIKDRVMENATKVSDSHIQTIINNILKASNKSYRNILETISVNLLTELYKKNPEKLKDYFEAEPTEKQVLKAIRETDILEKNRKVYEKANRMVAEGYGRNEIIKAIQKEYDYISTNRAKTIASNEASRAFVNSQYQADLQFLNAVGKMDVAYKELYSRSGNPCTFCQEVINKGPVPFTKPFVELGETLKTTVNGKEAEWTANYEAIDAGVLHVNCQCGYRLILKDETNGIDTSYNALSAQKITNKLTGLQNGESK